MKKIVLLMIFGILLTGSVLAFNVTQTLKVTIISGIINVFSPVQDNFYNSRVILFNISINASADYLKYSDNGKGFRTLCRNCDSYSRNAKFTDGFHEVVILAEFNSEKVYHYVNFSVDSRRPRIRKTTPDRRDFATGEFSVEFIEENPASLFLNYGNNLTGFREEEVNLGECTEESNKKICMINASLDDYDLQEIEYWFELTDKAGNHAKGRTTKNKVDFSSPIINSINYSIIRKRVIFNINITEENLEKVEYYDNNKTSPRWLRLCRGLSKGICKKRISFTRGIHNLDIRATDKAGNFATENIEFEIF